ncbi:membrane integrity-associated transporter subunit PqiC [Pseudomonas capeferrum]|uniref:PqiC family protein n=1 Tax=Pseudomonas capeferrum TaxID=1495066 RepID=UPI0015E40CC9|nr:PqiC family protein [Pseudomonas capeferrum]MBA1204411.1 membrane integrity-associated transporter subunit PqiC [Pseudomonas capeferrum]
MKLRAPVMLLVAALGLAACSSPPTHYYTLIASQDAALTTREQTSFQFEMLPVLIPVQVDQPQMVLREGGGSLAILENERWGAPLGDEFHDALSGQLERRFGTRDLAGLPRQRDQPVLSVRTDVRRFESVLNQYALIDVVWNLSLRSSDNVRRSLTCSNVIRQPAGMGLENLVLAHQRAVANLADAIAKTANDWARQPSARCWAGAR